MGDMIELGAVGKGTAILEDRANFSEEMRFEQKPK